MKTSITHILSVHIAMVPAPVSFVLVQEKSMEHHVGHVKGLVCALVVTETGIYTDKRRCDKIHGYEKIFSMHFISLYISSIFYHSRNNYTGVW